MRTRSSLIFGVLATAGCIAAATAHAHGGGSHTGFQARVSYIEPPQPGVLIQVLDGHVRLSLANLTPKTIVVPGAEGRPTIRVQPGHTEVWVEPRIGATEAPPKSEGLVRNWTIPSTADGAPFKIVGFLGYRPPPGAAGASENGGTPTWVVVLAIALGVLLLAAALAVPLLRRDPGNDGGRT